MRQYEDDRAVHDELSREQEEHPDRSAFDLGERRAMNARLESERRQHDQYTQEAIRSQNAGELDEGGVA